MKKGPRLLQTEQPITGCRARRIPFGAAKMVVQRQVGGVTIPVKPILCWCVLLAFASFHSAQFASAQEPRSFSPPLVTPLTAEQVVHNLIEMNSARAEALLAYEGTRTYRWVYRGFPRRSSADMVVKVRYRSPATKEFTIVSQQAASW